MTNTMTHSRVSNESPANENTSIMVSSHRAASQNACKKRDRGTFECRVNKSSIPVPPGTSHLFRSLDVSGQRNARVNQRYGLACKTTEGNQQPLSSTFYRSRTRGNTVDPKNVSYDANETAMKLAYFSSNGTLSPRKKAELREI